MTIHRLHSAFLSNKLSPSNLCRTLNKRITARQDLNALITVTEQVSQSQAAASSARYATGTSLGPFDGIPFVVKDNFCTDGIRTTCASKMLDNFHPPYTAAVVQRLIDQGGVLLGKTNMDEFGMGCGSIDGHMGPVRNPWSPKGDEWHIAGGSSGGSVVAVAAGLSVVALSSDTGGSTRNPAAYCGVVGFKPSYGSLSRYGLIPLVNSLDVPGIIAPSVTDAAEVFNLVNGVDPRDSTSTPGPPRTLQLSSSDGDVSPLRVGIPAEYHTPGMDPEVLAVWDEVAGWLCDAGCSVERVSMPHTQHSIKCYSVLCCAEVSSNMARYDGVEFGHRAEGERFTDTEHLYAATRREGFNDVVRGRILAGNYFLLRDNLDRYLHQAQRVWRLVHADFLSAFSRVDLLLTPVTPTQAPLHSAFSLEDNQTRVSRDDVCTQPVNLAGVPALSLPVRLSLRGRLPLSLQLVAAQGGEERLLSVARWVEARANFRPLCAALEDSDDVDDCSRG